MRVNARLLAAGAVAVGLWVQADAQTPPPQQPPPPPPPAAGQPQRPPVIRSGINFVSVDVIVTDRKTGEVVLDMKQDEFEVREDKKPQKVETFETVKIDAELNAGIAPKAIRSLYDEESAAREPNTRLFILLLDDYHVRRGNDMSVKKPLSDFVMNQLAPQDMVAVMYPMTPVSSLTFTRNRDSLLQSIKNFEGRKGLYEPRNEFEERYAYYPVQTVENIRNDVTLGALKGAAVRLGGMREGRKSIIFVSEGLTSTVPIQLNDPVAAMPGMPGRGGQPSPRGRVNPGTEVTDPRAQSQQFFDSADLTSRMKEAFDIVNRNNTSIYAVDPRGLAVFEFDINQGVGMQTDRENLNQSLDSLRVLADNTDGRAIVNRNDLAAGMQQIIRDSSAYYLVGYNSTLAPTDGKFHEIKVRVKRPGVQVRHRQGYWAYSADDVKRAIAGPRPGPPAEVSKALATLAPMTNRRYIRTWIGNDKGQDGQTRVTVLWEPLPPTPGVKRDEPRRVTVLATSGAGDIVYRGKVPTELATPGNGGIVRFQAPPGKLDLRLTIEGDGTGTLDSEDRALVIPDLSAPEVIFSTPKLWFARSAREFTSLTSGAPPAPTAIREFRRTDRLLVRLDAYAPADAPTKVSAQLLNQQGTKMLDLPVTAPTEGEKTYSIDFQLASLAPGQYLLEITGTSEGQKPVSELVAFSLGT